MNLQALLQVRQRLKRKQLAQVMNCSRSTIQRELKRGETDHLTTLLEKIMVNSPDLAQQRVEAQYIAKGPDYKIGADYLLVTEVSKKIYEDHFPPDAVIMHFEEHDRPTGIG